MEQNLKLSNDQGILCQNPDQYRRLVGRLIYLTITRPKITYVVNILSQFMHTPRRPHYDAALRVLRYIKSSHGVGILLSSTSSLELSAFLDSYWASCPMARQSTTEYFIMLVNSPISWKTKKQPVVSRSSVEAEYRAMATTTCELVWLKTLLRDLYVTHPMPITLHCDNQDALHIAANPIFHERTKHIEIDCHLVREKLHAKIISLTYVPSRQQLANIFTKALGKDQFQYLLGKLGVMDLHFPT
ncbi:hypothetical protein AB3S75_032551 [Citrus x aurantiifolia]